MKCINKKNLGKSQSLLGKEIKILKVKTLLFKMLPYILCLALCVPFTKILFFPYLPQELKHENIVSLLDYQVKLLMLCKCGCRIL